MSFDVPRPMLDQQLAAAAVGAPAKHDPDEIIETTRGNITRRDAAKINSLGLWIQRHKDALAAQRLAEEAQEKAEEALARQKQINALALDMLDDGQLLKLTELVRSMDTDVSSPVDVPHGHGAVTLPQPIIIGQRPPDPEDLTP